MADRRLELVTYSFLHINQWLPEVLDCISEDIAGSTLTSHVTQHGAESATITLPARVPALPPVGGGNTVLLVPFDESENGRPLSNYVVERGAHKMVVLVVTTNAICTKFTNNLLKQNRMKILSLGNQFEEWYDRMSEIHDKGRIEI